MIRCRVGAMLTGGFHGRNAWTRPSRMTFSCSGFPPRPARRRIVLVRCNWWPTPVAIGSRALDVLSVLIVRHGELVSKDEIMRAVWPGTAVEEHNLTVQISALRRILDAGP